MENVRGARVLIEEEGRVSLRALQQEFNLDSTALEDLIAELVEIQRVAVRDGRALAWAAGARQVTRAVRQRCRAVYAAMHVGMIARAMQL